MLQIPDIAHITVRIVGKATIIYANFVAKGLITGTHVCPKRQKIPLAGRLVFE